ncbi:MAG: DUF1540 domain-containing protein [Acutalibacteraceae bacterium]|nr:DUF1540 domain-containing protein [Acutalibacteraceae bacterium]
MDNMSNCKTENCISCSVKNCVHHTENDSCSAGTIKVGNRTACTCSETCCDTFKAKQ